MQGKGEYIEKLCVIHRITPAYAGKSQIFPILSRVIWDHPHVCGEKISRA